MAEIKLTKRYPNSRIEDITDAYMRGWNDALDAVQNGKFHIAEQTEPQTMLNDGTLVINVEDATKVGRVLVGDDKNRGGLYYPNYEEVPQTDCAWR